MPAPEHLACPVQRRSCPPGKGCLQCRRLSHVLSAEGSDLKSKSGKIKAEVLSQPTAQLLVQGAVPPREDEALSLQKSDSQGHLQECRVSCDLSEPALSNAVSIEAKRLSLTVRMWVLSHNPDQRGNAKPLCNASLSCCQHSFAGNEAARECEQHFFR